MLIVFAGLPATGKTSIARELARRLNALYLRIDSIEQALRDAAIAAPLDDAGYRVAYALAADNLRAGWTVVADSVNPLTLTRDAWLDVARGARVPAVEVEIVCSDPAEHRRRVESRSTDIPGLALPSWNDVASREYHPWHRPRIVIDTAGQSIDDCVARLLSILPGSRPA